MKGVKGILLMAGQGERFGDPIPKQYHHLLDKKVYLWTLMRLLDSQFFEEILLVCAPDWINSVQSEVSFAKNVRVIQGGKTRQESSFKALQACGVGSRYVVIHDSVRPFVSERILADNIEAAQKYQAVNTCIPSSDTIVYVPNGKTISNIPKRSDYLRGQTPQSFAYPLILEAHQKTKRTNVTDDCQLVLDLHKAIHIVEGDQANFKITTTFDLEQAKYFCKQVL